jgi:putative hydrolase of the HAD superfamily
LFWQAFWRELVVRYRLTADAAAAMQTVGAFYHTSFCAEPDAAAAVHALRRAGLRLAVLTNFELPSVDRTLAHVGIDPAQFDVLLSSAAIGVSKPEVRAYHAAADALGLPPAACLFVDDHPANVAGANAAGMRGVLLDRFGEHAGMRLETVGGLAALVALVRPAPH